MKKYIIGLLLLTASCTFVKHTVDQAKYKASKSMIKTAIRIYPNIADSSTKTLEFKLPPIELMEEGYLKNIQDTIVVGDSTGKSELILTVLDTTCIGKVQYKLKYIRDSIEIKLDCPTITLDTSEWKKPYEDAVKEIANLKKEYKRKRWFLLGIVLLFFFLGMFIYDKIKDNGKNK
jgi:hypothetical protein